jgi:outer membrane receptor protein involved in Fe transport
MHSPSLSRYGAVLLALCLAAPALAQRSAGTHLKVAGRGDSADPAAERAGEQAPLERLITLKLANVPLAQALEEIAREAGLTLGYSPDVLPAGVRVSLAAEGRSAGEVLDQALMGTSLDAHLIRERQLTLARRPSAAAGGERERTGSVTGRVTSAETGTGLSGASVRLHGARRGTLSGTDGTYRLDALPTGPHTLSVSLIGYSHQSQTVEILADETATANFALAISALPLDQVVVTGTLVPTEVRAIPTPISVITAEDIERQNIQRVDQLFRGEVPGAMAWDNGSLNYSSAIVIRGADAIASSSTVKTFIDGVEVADPRFIATIDPASIERVEITRGPQASTIYGSGATSGVMQIFTKKGGHGDPTPRIDAKISFGAVESPYASRPTVKQSHSLNIRGGSEGFSFNLGGSYNYMGEFTPEYFSREPSVYGGARVNQGPLTIDFSTRYYTKAFGWPMHPVFRDAGYRQWSTPFYQQDVMRQMTNGISAEYRVTSGWSHKATVGYDQTLWGSRNTRPRLRSAADTLYRLQDNRIAKTSFTYSSTLELQPSNDFSAVLAAGIDGWRYEVGGFSTTGAPTTSGINIAPARAYLLNEQHGNQGYFAQVRTDLWDRTFLTAGLRAESNENFGEDYGLALSPRFGISHIAHVGAITAKLRGAFGESIRPPAPHQRQAQSTASAEVLPNPDLGPERQVGGEIGLELFLAPGATLSVTAYDQHAHDLIENAILDGTTTPRTIQYQNLGRVRNSGFEIEATAAIEALGITGQYSIINSRVDALTPEYQGMYEVGDRLRGVPESAAAVSIAFNPLPSTSVTVRSMYAGDHMNIGSGALYAAIADGSYTGQIRDYFVTFPAFIKSDVSLTQAFGQRLSMFLLMENVGNSDAVEQSDLFLSPGRITTLGLRATF